MKNNQYFIYYQNKLYHLQCNTSKPQKPELLLCAFSTKFGDTNRTAMLFEKGNDHVICYTPRIPHETHSKIFTSQSAKTTNSIDKVAFQLMDMLPAEICTLTNVWILELHNHQCIILAEEKL